VSVTRRLLSKGGDGAGSAASYLTTSITPLPLNLVTCMVQTYTNTSVTPTRPTLSGCNIRWSDVGDVLVDNAGGGRTRMTVFAGASTAPTAGQLTIDYGGVSQRVAEWIIDQFGNCATWRQVATAGPTSATTITATLQTFRQAGNATVAYALNSDQLVSWTPGSGFTDFDTYTSAVYPAMLSEFQPVPVTAPSADVSSTALLGMVALELEATIVEHPAALIGQGGRLW